MGPALAEELITEFTNIDRRTIRSFDFRSEKVVLKRIIPLPSEWIRERDLRFTEHG